MKKKDAEKVQQAVKEMLIERLKEETESKKLKIIEITKQVEQLRSQAPLENKKQITFKWTKNLNAQWVTIIGAQEGSTPINHAMHKDEQQQCWETVLFLSAGVFIYSFNVAGKPVHDESKEFRTNEQGTNNVITV